MASLWEMAIKISINKLNLSLSLETITQIFPSQLIEVLQINLSHILGTQMLPFHHKDPFDRLLVAQALSEK